MKNENYLFNQQTTSIDRQKYDGVRVVSQVYETFDYGMFKCVHGNRDIDHVARLRQSISRKYVPIPITVNGKMEVIDGQNRLEVFKELELPVRYVIIQDAGIEEVRAVNQGAKNWGKKDFIKSYASEGKQEYVKYLDFCNEYPDIPPSIIELILKQITYDKQSHIQSFGKSCFNDVMNGTFVIRDFEGSRRVADMIMRFKGFDDNKNPIYRRKEFVSAIIRLSRNPDFDIEIMIRKIKLNMKGFKTCVTSNEYCAMLEDLYNYRNKDKVRFKY